MKYEKNGLAVIVQCRLSSTRLPGKAVKNLGGRPSVEWTLASMKKVKAEFHYVATDEDSYPVLEPICRKWGFGIFKGPLDDVLERYCLLIEKLKCRTVLRATADNPFLFYEAAELLCEEFEKQSKISKVDYMTWTGLPHGSGVEIFRADSLLRARKLTDLPFDREHVAPAIYNHKNVFSSLFYKAPARFYFPDYRTTIDTAGDFRRAIAVVKRLSKGVFPEEPYTTEQIMKAVKDPEVNDTVLFIPSVKKGCGTGHLRRSLSAAYQAGGFIYIPENPGLEETDEIVESFRKNHSEFKDFQIVRSLPETKEYSLLVTDSFKTEKSLYSELWKKGNILSIDEGSLFTENADFLLDIIPSVNLERKPNARKTEFIERPHNRKSGKVTEIRKILVCFGGEDPSLFTEKAVAYFSRSGLEVHSVGRKNPCENLKEKLFEYDLVVTHYGLTAFEALGAGCLVLLFPTSRLHEKLAEKYGFRLFDLKDFSRPFRKDYVSDIGRYALQNQGFLLSGKESPASSGKNMSIEKERSDSSCEESSEETLGGFIKRLSHAKRYFCPVCAEFPETPDAVVARTEHRTFRRCGNCGMIYISFSSQKETEYTKEYFSEEYKKQYGKTYLEDFSSIKKNGIRRIFEINSALSVKEKTKPAILDIGCAYGPFLSAADDDGWMPFGLDVSEDAVSYVQNTLLFPAAKASFPDFDSEKEFGISKFDAVSMWFVIEHFKDLKSVLEKVSQILKKGGVFAFSTPSAEGVSAKMNTEEFFEKSPKDHYSLWEPSTAGRILKRFGFKVVKIVSTGHHPERFPVSEKNAEKNGNRKLKENGSKNSSSDENAGMKLLGFYSRMFRLGDTFEVYCRKI